MRPVSVTVSTFVAFVKVTVAPSDFFSKTAPAIVVKSPSVMVLVSLTASASKVTYFFSTAAVTTVCLDEVTVSLMSVAVVAFSSYFLFRQSPRLEAVRAMTLRNHAAMPQRGT